jgi:hypothetical protein
MIEQSVIDTLIGAASDGRWERILGSILVALVALTRYVTRDRFSELVGEWISAVSALLGGIGAALLAGTQWWHAVLIGLVVLPSSKGFWDRIRDLLPRRECGLPPDSLVLALAVGGAALLSAGCGRCVLERGIVDALGAGITAAETSIGDDVDEDARLALRTARGVTIVGDSAVDACELLRDGEELGWQTWVGLALEATTGLVEVITGASDPRADAVPPELAHAVEVLETEAYRGCL